MRLSLLIMMMAYFSKNTFSEIICDETKEVRTETTVTKNELPFFNQELEKKKIFLKENRFGLYSAGDEEFSIKFVKTKDVEGRKPINRAVFCMDDHFFPKDIVMVYDVKSTEGNYKGHYNYELTGVSHSFGDSFPVERIYCSSFIDIENSNVFKYPMSFVKYSTESFQNILKKNLAKASGNIDLACFRVDGKDYKIVTNLPSSFTEAEPGSYDYKKGELLLHQEGQNSILIDSIFLYDYKEHGKGSYGSHSIISIGDYNGDGKLDFYIDYYFDGKSYPNYILVQGEGIFIKVPLDRGGGC